MEYKQDDQTHKLQCSQQLHVNKSEVIHVNNVLFNRGRPTLCRAYLLPSEDLPSLHSILLLSLCLKSIMAGHELTSQLYLTANMPLYRLILLNEK